MNNPQAAGGVAAATSQGTSSAAGDIDDSIYPSYLRGPIDESRMTLSPQERRWALQVKQAILDHPETNNHFSDFMFAQIALVEMGTQSLDNAIQHAMNVQAYRQDTDVWDTFEQGSLALECFIRRHPGYFLHVYKNLGVLDVTKLDITCFSSPREATLMKRGAYYQCHAHCFDLQAIREGLHWIMECEGFLWKAPKMANFEVFRMGFQDIVGMYPLKLNKFTFCNTGVMVNTLVSLVRPYTPNSITNKFHVGHKTEVRMDKVCLVPSLEAATDRVVREMTRALKRRYEAEKTFRL